MKKYVKNTKKKTAPLRILISIFVCALLIITASQIYKNMWYIKVGDYSITKPQYDMWRSMIVGDFFENYQDYVTALKIDTSKPIDEQIMKDKITWGEYFDSNTDMEIYTVLSSLNEMKKEAIDYQKYSYKEEYKELEEEAASMNMEVSNFIKYYYSWDLSEKKAEELLLMRAASKDYLTEKSKKAVTKEDYAAYYEEHKSELDSASAYIIKVENTSENIAMCNRLKEELTNLNDFIKKAEELQGNDGYTEYKSINDCPSEYSSWMFSAKQGEIITAASSQYCYLIMKDKQWKNESNAVNAYMIMFSGRNQSENADAAQNFISDFEETDKSKQSFIDMVYERTGDNGYIEGIIDYEITDGMADWLFNTERKNGDVTMLMNGDDMYVFFWDNFGEPIWKAAAKDGICSEKYKELTSEIRGKYEMFKR